MTTGVHARVATLSIRLSEGAGNRLKYNFYFVLRYLPATLRANDERITKTFEISNLDKMLSSAGWRLITMIPSTPNVSDAYINT